MSEFIGSRISLISKSDIKYIGTLHEINSDTSTVALENVTSYGTEGRKGNPAAEIPGSDQIYEYIVFRGSDVKELTIVEPPKQPQEKPAVPDDPAILGSARPTPAQPQQPQQQHFRGPQQQPPYPPYGGFQGGPPQQFQPPPPRFQQGPGQHGFPGAPGSGVPGYGMGYGPPPGYSGIGFGDAPPPGHFGPPPGSFSSPHQPPPPGPEVAPVQQPGIGPGPQQQPIGSGKGTPQPGQKQTRPAPPPPPVSIHQRPVEMAAPTPIAPTLTGPPPPIESKPTAATATAPPAPAAQAPQAPKRAANNRVAVPNVPSPRPRVPPAAPAATAAATKPQQSYADATQQATAAVAAAMAKLTNVPSQPGRPADGTVDNLAQKVNQMRVDSQQYRGRGRGRGAPRGGRRESAPRGNVEVPKEDYDFESANAKFNKQDLVKEAIATGSPVLSPNANGEHANPLEATNGHKEDDVVIPPAEPAKYDKKSSFFDNISSDSKDRSGQEGHTIDGRTMRREERSKNMETFGQGSVDSGFRGRGRGRGGYARRGYPARGGGFRGRGRGTGDSA